MSAGVRKDGTKRKMATWSNPKEKGYTVKDWDKSKPSFEYWEEYTIIYLETHRDLLLSEAFEQKLKAKFKDTPDWKRTISCSCLGYLKIKSFGAGTTSQTI